MVQSSKNRADTFTQFILISIFHDVSRRTGHYYKYTIRVIIHIWWLTPLHLAAERGKRNTVGVLLEKGASVQAQRILIFLEY